MGSKGASRPTGGAILLHTHTGLQPNVSQLLLLLLLRQKTRLLLLLRLLLLQEPLVLHLLQSSVSIKASA